MRVRQAANHDIRARNQAVQLVQRVRFIEIRRYSRHRCALDTEHSRAEGFQPMSHIRADIAHAEHKCGFAGNRLRMSAFLPDMRLFVAPVPPKRAVQRHQTADRILRDDRAERTGRIRQHHVLRQVFHARVLVRARPGELEYAQFFGLRQFVLARLAEDDFRCVKLLCGRMLVVLHERERALCAKLGI